MYSLEKSKISDFQFGIKEAFEGTTLAYPILDKEWCSTKDISKVL